jgi:hypothetical protein
VGRDQRPGLELEESLDFAFSPTLGYLTACPTNLGTGMRASAMMHLPALVIANQMEKVVRAVNQLGMVVRGLFGEGSDASGSIFQISNQTTLGESEEEILKRLSRVLQSIIEHELNARGKLLEADSGKLFDKIGRAYGILQNGHVLSSGEAMNLLSLIRLGVDLGVFPDSKRSVTTGSSSRPSPATSSTPRRANSRPASATSSAPRDCVPSLPISPARISLCHRTETTDPPHHSMSQEPMNNFTPRAQQVLALARKEADRFHHNYVGTEHILLGLIKLGQGVAVSVLQKMGLDLETVRAAVEKQVGTGQEAKAQGSIPYTPRVKKVLALAGKEAKALNHSYVGTEHILLGLLREGEGVAARVLKSLDVDIERTRNEILRELDPQFSGGGEGGGEEAAAGTPQRPGAQSDEKKEVKTPALKAFGRDLTELARKGEMDPVVGRKNEIRRVIQILCRRTKNNPS